MDAMKYDPATTSAEAAALAFAEELFAQWVVGDPDCNNGALILLSGYEAQASIGRVLAMFLTVILVLLCLTRSSIASGCLKVCKGPLNMNMSEDGSWALMT